MFRIPDSLPSSLPSSSFWPLSSPSSSHPSWPSLSAIQVIGPAVTRQPAVPSSGPLSYLVVLPFPPVAVLPAICTPGFRCPVSPVALSSCLLLSPFLLLSLPPAVVLPPAVPLFLLSRPRCPPVLSSSSYVNVDCPQFHASTPASITILVPNPSPCQYRLRSLKSTVVHPVVLFSWLHVEVFSRVR